MTNAKRWLLPDGVEEILPREAHKLESLRRKLLDLYGSWGYELVITPLIEFLDSLLVGSSHDLDLHTFKITDQLSGRMMGIRADITPQAARIDAHCLNREGPVRLCYADSVLHTKPRGLLTSRVPIRVGAELYGHAGVECDIELICLMHATLEAASVPDIHHVLGHVGIFRALVDAAQIDEETEAKLFDAVQRKAYDEISEVLNASVASDSLRDLLTQLTQLSGDENVLDEALAAFASAPESVRAPLDELAAIAAGVQARVPGVRLCFDLCELRGYQYHTGVVFAAYPPIHGRAVAKGGRYDDIGEVFGRARPASGFDSDLKTLIKLSLSDLPKAPSIAAPLSTDAELLALIASLRASGEQVVSSLSEVPASAEQLTEQNCDRVIVRGESGWEVKPV